MDMFDVLQRTVFYPEKEKTYFFNMFNMSRLVISKPKKEKNRKKKQTGLAFYLKRKQNFFQEHSFWILMVIPKTVLREFPA